MRLSFIVLATLLANAASAQTAAAPEAPRFGAIYEADMEGKSAVLTIQQPASGGRRVYFDAAQISCATSCSVTIERNGAPATGAPVEPVTLAFSGTAAAEAYADGNAGPGEVIERFAVPAGAQAEIDLAEIVLFGSNPDQNLTVRTSPTSGRVRIFVRWTESQVLLSGGGDQASPGGPSAAVQFSDQDAFGGDAAFVYDKAAQRLVVLGGLKAGGGYQPASLQLQELAGSGENVFAVYAPNAMSADGCVILPDGGIPAADQALRASGRTHVREGRTCVELEWAAAEDAGIRQYSQAELPAAPEGTPVAVVTGCAEDDCTRPGSAAEWVRWNGQQWQTLTRQGASPNAQYWSAEADPALPNAVVVDDVRSLEDAIGADLIDAVEINSPAKAESLMNARFAADDLTDNSSDDLPEGVVNRYLKPGATVAGKTPLCFDGPNEDDNEICLRLTKSPTADRFIDIPDADVTLGVSQSGGGGRYHIPVKSPSPGDWSRLELGGAEVKTSVLADGSFKVSLAQLTTDPAKNAFSGVYKSAPDGPFDITVGLRYYLERHLPAGGSAQKLSDALLEAACGFGVLHDRDPVQSIEPNGAAADGLSAAMLFWGYQENPENQSTVACSAIRMQKDSFQLEGGCGERQRLLSDAPSELFLRLNRSPSGVLRAGYSWTGMADDFRWLQDATANSDKAQYLFFGCASAASRSSATQFAKTTADLTVFHFVQNEYVEVAGPPPPPPPPPPPSGEGAIQILHVNGNAPAAAALDAAPHVSARVDGGQFTFENPSLRSDLPAGDHVLEFDFLPIFEGDTGRIEAGACSYPESGAECEVSSYELQPICKLPDLASGLGVCKLDVAVEGGLVTKVQLRYTVDPGGFADKATGSTADAAAYKVTNTACDNSPGSLGAALFALEKQPNAFIYLSEEIADPSWKCSDRDYRISNSDVTIYGWSASDAPYLQNVYFTINPLGSSAVCRPAGGNLSNVLMTGLHLRKTTPLVETLIAIENGASTIDCGGTIRDIAVVGNTLRLQGRTAPDDHFSMGRREIENVTVAKNVFLDNGNFGFQTSRYKTRLSAYENIFRRLGRLTWITWRESSPSGVTAPELQARLVNNFYSVTFNGTHIGKTMASRGAWAQFDDNFFMADSSAQNCRRCMNQQLVFCDNRAVNGAEAGFCGAANGYDGNGYAEGNIFWLPYRLPEFRILDRDAGTRAKQNGGAPSTHTNAHLAGWRALRVAGVRTAGNPEGPESEAAAEIETLSQDFRAFVRTDRFNAECSAAASWLQPADLQANGDRCVKTGPAPSVAYEGASDETLYVQVGFEMTSLPRTTRTLFELRDKNEAVLGRALIDPAGVLSIDNNGVAGGTIAIEGLGVKTGGNDNRYEVRMVYKDGLSGACSNTFNDYRCSILEAGVTCAAGAQCDLGMADRAIKYGYYGKAAVDQAVAKLVFPDHNDGTGEFRYDYVKAAPHTWCTEGGCVNEQ